MLPQVVEAGRVPGAGPGAVPGVRGAQLPAPRIPIGVRPATLDDLPFIDALQKRHTKQVGFLHRATLEGKIRLGHVLIAEGASGVALGYVIGNDQYFKRDDVGIIYQLNVVPEARRMLVAATLLKSLFDRSAYGCRLFCCWCAQDIEANRFWGAMGFVPLAFRAGSRKRDRIHIFWQKRIRSGDVSMPWWFPSQTGGGSIREDRLVLPIPPGAHWSDAKPMVLPGQEREEEESHAEGAETAKRERKKAAVAVKKPAATGVGGVRFGPPPVSGVSPPAAQAPLSESKTSKREKKPKPVKKNDPKLVAAARELRDRYLEEVNAAGGGRHALGVYDAGAKYDVTRALPGAGAGAGPRRRVA